jgi:lipoate-protein ligase A
MIYIVNKSTKPDFNIALEEYCFKNLTKFDKVFILWINEPSIIVGKNQNTHAEINEKFINEKGIHVVRRISGGGAVYHDLNNLNYTIISNESKDSKSFDFKSFSEPVIKTLKELGVDAEFSGRNDITIDDKKICGNAQAYLDGRVMHHGCILFDVDLTVLSKALETSKEVVDAKGVKSVRSRVVNILPFLTEKISVNEFANIILNHMKNEYPEMKEYYFNDEELKEIESNRQNKFGNWNWNFGSNPVAEIVRERRYPAGKTQIFINTKKGVIEDITFFGTFFGVKSDLSEFQKHLIDVKYTPDDIRKALSSYDITPYFAGFSIDELTDAIVG